jgi:hypothetical protein
MAFQGAKTIENQIIKYHRRFSDRWSIGSKFEEDTHKHADIMVNSWAYLSPFKEGK